MGSLGLFLIQLYLFLIGFGGMIGGGFLIWFGIDSYKAGKRFAESMDPANGAAMMSSFGVMDLLLGLIFGFFLILLSTIAFVGLGAIEATLVSGRDVSHRLRDIRWA